MRERVASEGKGPLLLLSLLLRVIVLLVILTYQYVEKVRQRRSRRS